jgi:hypothetical protein
MTVDVELLIPESYVHIAAAFTTKNPDDLPRISLEKWLDSEHSPIRALTFAVYLRGIPSFVSTHLVRHHNGVQCFVESNRPDRGGAKNVGRMTPVNMMMIINAQALINISRKRLCYKASPETRDVWLEVQAKVRSLVPPMADTMVPECQYRGRCVEINPCKQRGVSHVRPRTTDAVSGFGKRPGNQGRRKNTAKHTPNPRRVQPKPTA